MPAASLLNEIRSVFRRGRAGVASLLVCGVARPCGAASDQALVDLTWDSPLGCPQAAEVQQQIRTLLSGQENGQWQSSLHVRGTIVPSAQRFELTLLIQQGQASGKRVIASDDCQTLGKAAAVVLGLLIRKEQRLGRELSEQEISGDAAPPPEPAAPGTADPSTPSPAKSDNSQAASEAPKPSAAPPMTPSSRGLAVLLGPALSLDAGTLPNANLGLGLGGGVFVGGWRGFATASVWLSQTYHPFEGQPLAASFARQSAELDFCHAWWLHESFEVGPCVQGVFDHVAAKASGGRLVSRSTDALLFSAGTGLAAFWHLASAGAVALLATGRVATHRPTFSLETPFGLDRVHTIPALTISGSLAYVWIF